MSVAGARAAALVRMAAGVIFLAEGYSKIAGKFVRGAFADQSREIAAKAWPFWGRFLHGFVIPSAPAFAWFIALGELATGLGLLLGLWTRVASFGGALLVLSIALGQTYVPGETWDRWVTAGLPSKFAVLLLVLLGATGVGRVWGMDGRVRTGRHARE